MPNPCNFIPIGRVVSVDKSGAVQEFKVFVPPDEAPRVLAIAQRRRRELWRQVRRAGKD